MWSHGSGERASINGSAWWKVLSGQMRKAAPTLASFAADRRMSSPTPSQSPRSTHAL